MVILILINLFKDSSERESAEEIKNEDDCWTLLVFTVHILFLCYISPQSAVLLFKLSKGYCYHYNLYYLNLSFCFGLKSRHHS